MPSRDHYVLMTLKLDRWSQDHSLRSFEIERELAASRQPCVTRARTRKRRLALGNLKMLWTSRA